MSTNDTSLVAAITKLSGTNYSQWFSQIRWALRGRELWETVEPGTSPDPNDVTPEAIVWRKKADKAKDMLDTLKEDCLSSSFANQLRLRRQLNDFAAGPMGRRLSPSSTPFLTRTPHW